MTRLIPAFVASVGLLSAAAPSESDIRQALRYAESQWGVRVTAPMTVDAVRLNDCAKPYSDQYAVTVVYWSQSAIVSDEPGSKPVTNGPVTYSYGVQINSACQWTPELLNTVMTHEMGHILIGANWHSDNPRSIMHRYIYVWQRVTESDRSRIVNGGAIEQINLEAKK